MLNSKLIYCLKSSEFPPNAQLSIIGKDIDPLMTNGMFHWSSGWLKYYLNRHDITGLIGRKRIKYDPFQSFHHNWSNPMVGLDSLKPLFLYRYSEPNTIVQYRYACVWGDNEKWKIMDVDLDDGHHFVFGEGTGVNEYLNYLAAQNIRSDNVYWDFGEIATSETSL